MKIRFLKNGVSDGAGRKFAWGDTADIPDELAAAMIANGVAKPETTAPASDGAPAGNKRMLRRIAARGSDDTGNH